MGVADFNSSSARGLRTLMNYRRQCASPTDMHELKAFGESDIEILNGISDQELVGVLINSILLGDVDMCRKVSELRPELEVGEFIISGGRFLNKRSTGVMNMPIDVMPSQFLAAAGTPERINEILSIIEGLRLPDGAAQLLRYLLDNSNIERFINKFYHKSPGLAGLDELPVASIFMPNQSFDLPVFSAGLVSNPELIHALSEAHAHRPQGVAYEQLLCWATPEMVSQFPDDLIAFKPVNDVSVREYVKSDTGSFTIRNHRIDLSDIGGGEAGQGIGMLDNYDWYTHTYAGGEPLDHDKPCRIDGIALGLTPCLRREVAFKDWFALGHYANAAQRSGLGPEFNSGLLLCSTSTTFLSSFELGQTDLGKLSAIEKGVDSFMPLGWISCLNTDKDDWDATTLPDCGIHPTNDISSSLLVRLAHDPVLKEAFIDRVSPDLARFIVKDATLRCSKPEVIHMANSIGMPVDEYRSNEVVFPLSVIGSIESLDVKFKPGLRVSVKWLAQDFAMSDELVRRFLGRYEGDGTFQGIDINLDVEGVLSKAVECRHQLDDAANTEAAMLRHMIGRVSTADLTDAAGTAAQWKVVLRLRDRDEVMPFIGKAPASIRVQMVQDDFNI